MINNIKNHSFISMANGYLIFIGTLLMVLFLYKTPPSFAQAQTPTPEAVPVRIDGITASNGISLTFAYLGQPTFNLTQPGAASMSFSLPYRWQPYDGEGYIDLHFDASQLDPQSTITQTAVTDLVTLDVYFDNIPIASFAPPLAQDQILRLPLPYGVFTDLEQTRHTIRFLLQGRECGNTTQMQMTIRDESAIYLEYDVQPIIPDLAAFPRPLFQESLTPESILLLIPDEYTDADLTAAASIAAALGQELDDDLTLSLSTPTAVTGSQLRDQSVIIIGSPTANSFTADLYQRNLLPGGLNADGILTTANGQPIPPDAGVLQEIVSTNSDDYAYLIVTGGSDEAIERAARALSANGAGIGLHGDFTIIEAVQDAEYETDVALPSQFTLEDIGFPDRLWTGLGKQAMSREFTIPANWVISEDANLTFSYLASDALDTDHSSFHVELNGEYIEQVPLPEVGEQITITLPVADLRLGESNRLAFIATLALDVPCPPSDAPQAWLRFRNDGVISLPHDEITIETPVTVPLQFNPDLSNLLFALPASPSEMDLNIFIQTAQMLGIDAYGIGLNPLVQRTPITETDSLEPYQVIAIGLPSTNNLITAFNDQLPQPFLPGEDGLGEIVGNLQYRLPDDFSVGVIQHLPAPWNPALPFVIISGTTDEGLEWAANALADGNALDRELEGNVIFIKDTFIESFRLSTVSHFTELVTGSDIMTGTISAAIVTPTAVTATGSDENIVSTPTPTPITDLPDKYRADNTIPSSVPALVAALIGGGLILIVGGVFYTWRKSRR